MRELTEMQAQAANIGLKKMFSGKHFSICDLDNMAKLLDVPLAGPDYDALRLLHCVDWADMPRGYKQQVCNKCLELLGVPPAIIDGDFTKDNPLPVVTPATTGCNS